MSRDTNLGTRTGSDAPETAPILGGAVGRLFNLLKLPSPASSISRGNICACPSDLVITEGPGALDTGFSKKDTSLLSCKGAVDEGSGEVLERGVADNKGICVDSAGIGGVASWDTNTAEGATETDSTETGSPEAPVGLLCDADAEPGAGVLLGAFIRSRPGRGLTLGAGANLFGPLLTVDKVSSTIAENHERRERLRYSGRFVAAGSAEMDMKLTRIQALGMDRDSVKVAELLGLQLVGLGQAESCDGLPRLPNQQPRVTHRVHLQCSFANADNAVKMETDASDDDREYEEEEEDDFEEMEDDFMDFDGLEGEYDDELQLDNSEAVQFILSSALSQGGSSHLNPRKTPYLHKDNRSEDATQTPAGASSAAERRKHSVYRILKSRETGLMNTQNTLPIAKRFIPNQTKAVVDKYGARAYSGQFSEDGKFFFSCTQDFHVHLYDTSDLNDIRRQRSINAEVGRWTITDCALSPDNRHMIYSSITPIVHLTRAQLDRDDPEQIPLDFDQHFDSNFGIWSIRFSGDGREIVAGTSNNLIVVYDIETRSILHQIPGHTDDVNAVCYAEPMSSHVLFSASDDSFVKVWDRRSLGRNAQPAGVLVGHTEGITYVSSKGDNRYALTNGKDQHMKMWDVRKMMEPNQVRKDLTLRTGYYSEDWDYRIMRYPGSVEFRHPKDCSVQTFTGHSVLKTLIRCHFSPPASTGQRFVYTGSEDGIIRIFALDGTLVQALDPADALKAASFDDAELANHAIFELLRPRMMHKGGVTRDVSWHPDLPCIISTSWCGAGGAFGATVKHEYVEQLNP